MPNSSNKIETLQMVVTDLDGTLLTSDGKVSDADYSTLVEMGEKGIVRVIATGRNPYSFSKVIPSNFPIDYLIFSSGAGAIDWKTKELLYTSELDGTSVQTVVDLLMKNGVDFMVHEPITANHRFLYFHGHTHNPDFERRIELYKNFCQPYIPGVVYDTTASQILAVLPHNVELFDNLKNIFPDLKVIRATSPIDGHSIWMEIFSNHISKAYGIQWICEIHNITLSKVVAIGNDFNDLDMLGFVPCSFVVENAPIELRENFETVKSNNDSGFSDAVLRIIGGR